jgi:hypothetical protein
LFDRIDGLAALREPCGQKKFSQAQRRLRVINRSSMAIAGDTQVIGSEESLK